MRRGRQRCAEVRRLSSWSQRGRACLVREGCSRSQCGLRGRSHSWSSACSLGWGWGLHGFVVISVYCCPGLILLVMHTLDARQGQQSKKCFKRRCTIWRSYVDGLGGKQVGGLQSRAGTPRTLVVSQVQVHALETVLVPHLQHLVAFLPELVPVHEHLQELVHAPE